MEAPTETDQVIDGRYRLLERVGVGGMSTVHRARDEQLGREVAIKLFPTEVATDEDDRRRRDEVRLLGSIVHPALVTLYDAALDHEPPYLAMEFVDGEDLRTRLTRGPLDEAAVTALGSAIADALDAVHARGIVHRDLKPGNILLPASAPRTGVSAKLTDFGIARLVDSTRVTAAGTLIGTAAYLSPEQASGRLVTPASDVYSLGLVLLECLTGHEVYPGSAVEAAAARLSAPPEIPADVSPPLAGLLRRMTAMDPGERPTAASVAQTLSAAGPTGTAAAPADVATVRMAAPEAEAGGEPTAVTRELPEAAPVAAVPGAVTAATAPTTPDAAVPTATAAPTAPPVPAPATGAAPAQPRRRAPWIVAIVVIVVVVAAVATVLLMLWLNTSPESVPNYPAVEGELGEHLEQLQRTVNP